MAAARCSMARAAHVLAAPAVKATPHSSSRRAVPPVTKGAVLTHDAVRGALDRRRDARPRRRSRRATMVGMPAARPRRRPVGLSRVPSSPSTPLGRTRGLRRGPGRAAAPDGATMVSLVSPPCVARSRCSSASCYAGVSPPADLLPTRSPRYGMTETAAAWSTTACRSTVSRSEIDDDGDTPYAVRCCCGATATAPTLSRRWLVPHRRRRRLDCGRLRVRGGATM